MAACHPAAAVAPRSCLHRTRPRMLTLLLACCPSCLATYSRDCSRRLSSPLAAACRMSKILPLAHRPSQLLARCQPRTLPVSQYRPAFATFPTGYCQMPWTACCWPARLKANGVVGRPDKCLGITYYITLISPPPLPQLSLKMAATPNRLFTTTVLPWRGLYKLYFLLFVSALLSLFYYRFTHIPTTHIPLWLLITAADFWFAVVWLFQQGFRWAPTFHHTHRDRLPAQVPAIDVFVCTADPVREPPTIVVNTLLSMMAYEYPSNDKEKSIEN
ncbi:Cellulose synthase-like protein E1 [Nymphaea thermarum]|nr:Cellulose synthase-like protein E1 [Nymphaea thermarum]